MMAQVMRLRARGALSCQRKLASRAIRTIGGNLTSRNTVIASRKFVMFCLVLLWMPAFAGMTTEDPTCLSPEKWAQIDSGPWTLRSVKQDTDYSILLEGELDYTSLQNALSELSSLYQGHGFFGVQVKACIRVVSLVAKEVDVEFSVDPGPRAFIRNMEFRGIKHISRSEIEGVMLSHPKSAMSQVLRALDYGALQIEEDRPRIVELYQSRGYLDARVKKVAIHVSDDLSFCDLKIEIEEGKFYRVGKIEPSEWQPDISLKAGDIFDLPRLTEEVEKIMIPLRDQGYAFAKATPDLTLNKDLLSVRYRVDPGARTVIRSIKVSGNDFTQSDTITRDFADLEGKVYSYSETELRRLRLIYKGAVSDAHISLSPTTTNDIYDLEVKVVERFPIRFNLAPYYLSGEGLILSAYVLHQNLLGRNVLGLIATQLSSLRQTFELAFYAPRLGGKEISWLTEFHDRQYSYFSFWSYTLGGGGRLNFRVNDHLNVGTGFGLDDVSVATTEDPSAYTPYVTLPNGNARGAVFVSATAQPLPLSLDQNQVLAFDAKLTYTGPLSLSEFDYAEVAAGIRWGFSLRPFVFRGRISGGVLLRIGDLLLPISDRYFLGGQSSLRGYQILSVGPWTPGSATIPSVQIGGVKKITQTIEMEMSIMKFLDMKAYLFTDMGNAYSESQSWFEGGIAAAVGIGVTATVWRIPLKCEVAKALVNLPGALSIDVYAGLSAVNW